MVVLGFSAKTPVVSAKMTDRDITSNSILMGKFATEIPTSINYQCVKVSTEYVSFRKYFDEIGYKARVDQPYMGDLFRGYYGVAQSPLLMGKSLAGFIISLNLRTP